MSLTVAEIRDRAARLKAAITRDRYETRAGLKERSSLAGLYEEHRLLRSAEALPTIQRALAEATGEERRRLRALFAWVADQRVEASLAPLEDELRGWESGATVSLAGRELPLRRVVAAMARAPERGERLAWDAARNRRLEDAAALRLDILHREREAVAELGLGGYLDARERLAGLDLRGLEREGVRIIAGTEDAYREHLAYHVRKRIGVEPGAAARSDVAWLRQMSWLSERFRLEPVLEQARRDLAELGLPLSAGGRVRLDLEARPLKSPDSFSAPLDVPGEVILVVAPTGGWDDAESLLHEIGHTLHFAYTAPGLPFEDRALGDTTVTETFAILFESLVLEPRWVDRVAGLQGAEADEYLRLAGFLKLYRVRRHAALLLYDLELASARRPGEMGPRYAELLGGATGFAYDPQTCLEDRSRGFWIARRVRAWMLGAILQAVLRDRFDEDWYRNPAAGPFLGEILSAGQRDDAAQLAGQLGTERLTSEPLVEQGFEWVE